MHRFRTDDGDEVGVAPQDSQRRLVDQLLGDVAAGWGQASGDVGRPETLGHEKRRIGRLPRERSNSDDLLQGSQ